MRTSTELTQQLDPNSNDSLRVLIVGAGVAGLTVARMLRTAGLHPVLIERTQPDAGKGYMLALMPLVDPILRHTGVKERYMEQSVPLDRYRLHDRHGNTVRDYSMAELLADYGDYQGIDRGSLLDVLSTGGIAVSFGTTVTALDQQGETVRATFSPGESAEFDVVIAADGLHSATRALVLPSDQVDWFDTGWGGWIAWADIDEADADLGEETWGAGFFMGLYPVKGRDGVFIGGDRDDTTSGPASFASGIRDKLDTIDGRSNRALESIATSDDPYYWKLVDCRAKTWSSGRVVLVGDAAAGFLPTAGIGAAMAMESAGQLALHLIQSDRAGVPAALAGFEASQRPRVEAAQGNSRQLARLMFQRNPLLATVRDVATHVVTVGMALGPIRKLLDEAPGMSPAPQGIASDSKPTAGANLQEMVS